MNALALQYDVSDIERMARAFAGSKLFGVHNPEQALALCLIAQAEGRHPASAAQDYNIIQGRPSKKADAMLRDFLTAGGKVEWHELNDTIADATFSHPAGGTVRISWDMARVKKAGISNAAMYAKYPRPMLRSRVVSEGVRTVFPMATSGMYVPEEVEDIAAEKRGTATLEPPANTTPMIEGQVVEADPPVKSAAQAKRDGDWETLKVEIDSQPTLEQLEILVASRDFQQMAKALPKAWVTELKDYVQTARDEFAKAGPVAPNFDDLEASHEPA